MIKKVFLFLLLLSVERTVAQSYYPLLLKENTWLVKSLDYLPVPPDIHYYQYSIWKDTTINNLSYSQIASKEYMREDSVSGKVYYYTSDDPNKEIVIYNFKAQKGDSIESPGGAKFVIDSISKLKLITGEERKVFYYSWAIENSSEGFYIEGIGSCYGLTQVGQHIGPPSNSLVCFKKDTIATYGSECNRVGIEECRELTINIFPNPVLDKVNINYSEPLMYSLVDILGRLRLKGRVENSCIELSGLEDGIYFIRLLTSDNSFKNMTLIKKSQQ